jgi:hypothetical protein
MRGAHRAIREPLESSPGIYAIWHPRQAHARAPADTQIRAKRVLPPKSNFMPTQFCTERRVSSCESLGERWPRGPRPSLVRLDRYRGAL